MLVCTPDDAGLEERVLSGGPAVLRNAMRDWDLSKHSLTVLNSLFADRHVSSCAYIALEEAEHKRHSASKQHYS